MGTGSQSATMYQLAVVLTCMRPPRLEEAEAMFRLVLDGNGYSFYFILFYNNFMLIIFMLY